MWFTRKFFTTCSQTIKHQANLNLSFCHEYGYHTTDLILVTIYKKQTCLSYKYNSIILNLIYSYYRFFVTNMFSCLKINMIYDEISFIFYN